MKTSIALTAALVMTFGSVPDPILAQEVLDRGSAEAMAPFPLVYVVRYLPGAAYASDRPLLRQDLRAHEKYMRRMTEEGTIIAAGPTFDEAGGIVLIRTADSVAAAAFVENDPAVVAGIFAGTVTDWRPVFDAGKIFRRTTAPGGSTGDVNASPSGRGQE